LFNHNLMQEIIIFMRGIFDDTCKPAIQNFTAREKNALSAKVINHIEHIIYVACSEKIGLLYFKSLSKIS